MTVQSGLRWAVLGVLLVVVLYPLVWLLGSSLKSPADLANGLSILPSDANLDNYARGWTGLDTGDFGTFFLNSTVIAAGTVLGNVVSCLFAAYAFARLRFPLRRAWFVVLITTLMLPQHILVIPQYLLFRWIGWTDSPLPLIVPRFLATEAFFVFLMVQLLRGLPATFEESAKVDGCSPYGVFRWVILPLGRPAIVTTAIFSFIWAWNDFFPQLIYLNDTSRYTVPLGLRQFAVSSGQTDVAPMFAMSLLSLLPVFLFFVTFQRLLMTTATPIRLR